MKLSTLLVLNALVAGVFGVWLIAAPSSAIETYGNSSTPNSAYLAQLLGAAFVAFAVISFLARNAHESTGRKAIVTGLCLGDLIGFVFALLATTSGVINQMGWSSVAIYGLLGIGFGYFAFVKKE